MTTSTTICPVATECGGCTTLDLSPADQRAQLKAQVERSTGLSIDEVVPSPASLGYRARLRLRPTATGALGLTRPRSHDVVTISHCPVAHPLINAVLAKLPPMPGFDGIELRTDGTRVVLCASSRPSHGPAKKTRKSRRSSGPKRPSYDQLRTQLDALDLDAVGLAGAAIDGARVQGDVLLSIPNDGDLSIRVSPNSFFQVNLAINTGIVQRVQRWVRAIKPARVLDLYAGIGNLSLGLAAQGIPLTLVESAPSAGADTRWTLKNSPVLRGAAEVEVKTADAGRYAAGDSFFDVALLDPPRGGAPDLIPHLLVTRPRALIYLSCNPRALGRDLGALRDQPWSVAQTVLFEMFPNTGHAEVLTLILRDDLQADADAILGEFTGSQRASP